MSTFKRQSRSKKIPKCIGGHTDHIISIVYGEPTPLTMEKAKKGLVHIGGCDISLPCPRYYCLIHNIEI